MAARQALVAPAAGLTAAPGIGSAWIDALQLAPAPAGGARLAHQPAGVMELSSPDSAAVRLTNSRLLAARRRLRMVARLEGGRDG
jgi:hypothetical protein